jgi:hypothetical protein
VLVTPPAAPLGWLMAAQLGANGRTAQHYFHPAGTAG